MAWTIAEMVIALNRCGGSHPLETDDGPERIAQRGEKLVPLKPA